MSNFWASNGNYYDSKYIPRINKIITANNLLEKMGNDYISPYLLLQDPQNNCITQPVHHPYLIDEIQGWGNHNLQIVNLQKHQSGVAYWQNQNKNIIYTNNEAPNVKKNITNFYSKLVNFEVPR